MSELLNRFRICSEISEEIKLEIKIFHVFNDNYNKQNVLFITSDDKVFGFGSDRFGCCGLGHNSVVNEPQIIPELCHKNIQQFFFGWTFILGLTSDKYVYGWGRNDYGQLGRGYVSEKAEYLKPEIIEYFENVIQLSCGTIHTLALSSDGKIYGWGDNNHGQIGCGREKGEIIANPIHLQTFTPFSVKLLQTFDDRSYALTTDGLVYSWGSHVCCSLGYEKDKNEYEFEPKLIANIPKMLFVCPSSVNTYFLTNERELYFCGRISVGNKFSYQNSPSHIHQKLRFSSMHSLNYYFYVNSGWVSAFSENIFYRLFENQVIKYDYSSHFDFYSYEYEMSYKTIHIKNFDANDLNDLHNYKNFKNMFEILGDLGSGGFGKVYKAKNKYDQGEFAIKEILFNGKSFVLITLFKISVIQI